MTSKDLLLTLAFFLLFGAGATAQSSPVGIWKTIDDQTGEAKSHVEIYQKDGRYYGKVVRLLQSDPEAICEKCPGDKQGQPVLGMEVLWNLQAYQDYWSYGQIMDPENGKTYKCSLWLEGNDRLKVRGYIGISMLGRNQDWHRVK